MVAPADEPLLSLFDEIWVRETYLPKTWTPVPAPTVVDVGANVGVFTVWAAKRLGAARIVAIEPSPEMVRALGANLARNRIEQATVLEVALGGEPGESTLYRRAAGALDTLFDRDNYGSRFQTVASVTVTTLDDIFSTCEIDVCDLLKLDCEGAEYEILFNASGSTLAKIRHIAAEYHVGLNEYGPASVQSFLEARGFAVTCSALLDEESGYLYASRRP